LRGLENGRQNILSGLDKDGYPWLDDVTGEPREATALDMRKAMTALVDEYIDETPGYYVRGQDERQNILKRKWENLKNHGAGMTDAEAERVYKEAMKKPGMEDFFALFDQVNKETLEVLREGGLIKADGEYQRLAEAYKAYSPLRREKYENEHLLDELLQRPGGGRQLSVRSGSMDDQPTKPIKAIQNALAKLDAAYAAAEQNKARNQLFDRVVGNPEHWANWFDQPAEKKAFFTKDENGFLVRREGTDMSGKVLHFVRNGKSLFIAPKMENEKAVQIVRALNNLDVQKLNGPMRAFDFVNGIIRASNVLRSSGLRTLKRRGEEPRSLSR
jgi:hypothetical protein